MVGNHLANPVTGGSGLVQAAVGKQHDQFVAADPGRKVRAAQRRPYHFAECPQHGIADDVRVPIVEMVLNSSMSSTANAH